MTYSSEEITLRKSAETVFEKISDLENLTRIIADAPKDQIDPAQLEQLSKVRATKDSISFPAGPIGEITLRLTEAVAPTLIRLTGEGTPVPLSLAMHIRPVLPEECVVKVEIDLQIPAMLKPMVSGPMQKMADQFGQMLRELPL